ncbi:DUF2637 domain-containing protein [Streptomyces sp. NPDC001876]|uniref:DUF2637 domain-containing protein n=1 Tax=Streptomyces sp. NPDC001876 TaxID=3154402 RepID=UPI00331A1319
MNRPTPAQGLAAGATAATVLLTAAAFWLSYEHLHDVADGNGLDDARAWVWPATVDLFIIAGELLILRASLQHRVDWWAIALAATGSLGSIALNVAGVGDNAERMEYIVAAVPPVAALLAFGALMRQVHEALASVDPVVEVVPLSPPTAVVTHPVPVVVPAGARLLPLVSTQVTIKVTAAPERPAVPRPVPEAVPAGAVMLPVVAAGVTTEVTIERVTEEPEQPVNRPAIATLRKAIGWPYLDTLADHPGAAALTSNLAAMETRQVVTVPVTITPSELRKQARALNREVVRDTGKPVTIERLRDEYNLSRRDATDLRREVVEGKRS